MRSPLQLCAGHHLRRTPLRGGADTRALVLERESLGIGRLGANLVPGFYTFLLTGFGEEGL